MSGVEESSKKKLFDPETAFFDLPIVRNTFGIACLVVAVSFGLITIFSWSKPVLDMDGFNGFIGMYKFPLGSVAFFGGLFAFYATNHRSEQQKRAMELTQKSIDLAGEQNRFANYYKHVEEFSKYCKSLEDQYKDQELVIFSRKLHSSLYPGGPAKVLKADTRVIKNIEVQLTALNMVMRSMLDGNEEKIRSEGVGSWGNLFDVLVRDLNRIMDSNAKNYFAIVQNEYFEILGFLLKDADNVNKILFSVSVIQRLIEFDFTIKNLLNSLQGEFLDIISDLQRIGIDRKFELLKNDLTKS